MKKYAYSFNERMKCHGNYKLFDCYNDPYAMAHEKCEKINWCGTYYNSFPEGEFIDYPNYDGKLKQK